jgi:uncharacterized circularly permuted ATP-grasp superfamily protein
VRLGAGPVSRPPEAAPVDAAYDEAFAAPGVPRRHYAPLLEALAGVDLAALRDTVNERVQSDGVTFASGDGEAFVVDPIPRILTADEWSALAAGLEQRVRALNAFVLDAYGARRIVDAGHMAADVIESAEGYEPDLRGSFPEGAAPIGVAGLDVVRGPAGALQVLEDNVRTPSGFTYAVAARRAVEPTLPAGTAEPLVLSDLLTGLLAGVVRGAAPAGAGDPCAVVLSDGPGRGAFWEHAEAARRLGVPVVTLAELERRGDRLEVRLEDGRRRPVDVVYRRCNEDRLRDEGGALTPLAEALLEPWRAGRLAVVNAFGAGVADDKLAHAYVEDMIRFYLGEEPLLGAVPTLDLGRPEALEAVLGDLRGHVTKPRFGHGGVGVVVCAHADEPTLEHLRGELRADPGGFVAQPIVALSSHPTVVDPGRLEPRHVDLRPFVFCAGTNAETKIRSLPGGLTRVAWDAHALVVNSSQNGGAKDTWVLRPTN